MADELLTEAQRRGTRVHKAVEDWLDGITPTLPIEEGRFLQGFIDWQEKSGAGLLESELFLISEQYKYAGRCDLIMLLDGQRWIIDIKTGAARPGHGIQLKFYEQAYYEMTGERCRMGVLGLTNKTQKGYRKLKEYKEPMVRCIAHKAVFDFWRKANPVPAPVDGSLIWAK